MTEETLEMVAKLLTSPDEEMKMLGEEMFIQNNPNDKDVSILNSFKGYPPMTYIMNDIKFKHIVQAMQIHNNECNIF